MPTACVPTSLALTGLAPQATDSTDLAVGVDSSAAGLRAGTLTVSPLSDQGGVTTPFPAVVIRSRAASIASVPSSEARWTVARVLAK